MMPNSAHIDSILKFLASQQPMMLILGSKDNDKAKLLTEVVKISRASQYIIRLQASSIIKPSQFISLLSKNWKTPIANEDSHLKMQLEEMLSGISKNDISYLLVIDDANLLSYSVMAALSYLVTMQENRDTRLHIILSGDLSLNEKMKNCELKTPPFLNLDDNHPSSKSLTPKPNKLFMQFFRKHIIKSFSIIALIIFTFFIHWFDQKGHEFFKIPAYNAQFLSHKKSNTPSFTKKHPAIQSNTIKPPSASPPQVAKKSTINTNKGYIIQLMSDPNKAVIDSFIDEYHLKNHVKVIKNYFHHHDWYLLAYGYYLSYAQARKALYDLPKNLKLLHPWIRPEKDIHPNNIKAITLKSTSKK